MCTCRFVQHNTSAVPMWSEPADLTPQVGSFEVRVEPAGVVQREAHASGPLLFEPRATRQQSRPNQVLVQTVWQQPIDWCSENNYRPIALIGNASWCPLCSPLCFPLCLRLLFSSHMSTITLIERRVQFALQFAYRNCNSPNARRSDLHVQVDVAVPKAYVYSAGSGASSSSAPPASGVFLALHVDRGGCGQLAARGLFLVADFENSSVLLTTDIGTTN